jgi:hypothetical protein
LTDVWNIGSVAQASGHLKTPNSEPVPGSRSATTNRTKPEGTSGVPINRRMQAGSGFYTYLDGVSAAWEALMTY